MSTIYATAYPGERSSQSRKLLLCWHATTRYHHHHLDFDCQLADHPPATYRVRRNEPQQEVDEPVSQRLPGPPFHLRRRQEGEHPTDRAFVSSKQRETSIDRRSTTVEPSSSVDDMRLSSGLHSNVVLEGGYHTLGETPPPRQRSASVTRRLILPSFYPPLAGVPEGERSLNSTLPAAPPLITSPEVGVGSRLDNASPTVSPAPNLGSQYHEDRDQTPKPARYQNLQDTGFGENQARVIHPWISNEGPFRAPTTLIIHPMPRTFNHHPGEVRWIPRGVTL
ncbi:hypothetical protein BDV98DRAFT_422343 [Pterulicium gracile]|uniref:Uncharacterized protein n=1 Tax=Pterulicium gracile TaxID=1884261 RepID=A0A5C3Q2G0_9AGAR|nr:hypothetical protein BDV98DRAFT_422343 [Pterula gracilis]